MSSSIPLVTVLLPALRDDLYLREAIKSLLNQSFADFQIFLIADGNWNLEYLERQDSRIRHIKVGKNLNLSQKLNFGIEESKSKYLARMDADDIAHIDRLKVQASFLEVNSNVDLLGTGIRFIGGLPNHRNAHGEIALLPSRNDELLDYMLYKNPFFHPTIMIRSETLNRYNLRYNVSFERSQDLELWSRAAGKLTFANIREPLLDYRLHQAQVGVIGKMDSEYFSSIALLRYCITCIIALDRRTIPAIKILPFRINKFISSRRNQIRKD